MKRTHFFYSILVALVLSVSFSQELNAQKVKFAISTNALDWANFGTANLELGVGITQHFSLQAVAKYNPWEFTAKKPQIPVRYNQMTFGAGVRWWPWYVFSGWWIGAKGQYSDYTKTGIWRPALEEGTRIGGGLSFGYTLMVHKKFNIEFGAGVWGGAQTKYDLYCCTKCMELRKTGSKGFIDVDFASISLMYVF